MRPSFRCGPLIACSTLLEAIPRPALIAALVRHATSLPIYGEPVITHYEEGETRFTLETDADRKQTMIRLK